METKHEAEKKVLKLFLMICKENANTDSKLLRAVLFYWYLKKRRSEISRLESLVLCKL